VDCSLLDHVLCVYRCRCGTTEMPGTPPPPPHLPHTQRAYEPLKDARHALTRRSPNALRVLHHDDIIEDVRRMLRRGGVPSTKEPRLAVLHIQGPSSARPPAGARGDLPFSLEGEQRIGDVSIIDDGYPPGCRNVPLGRSPWPDGWRRCCPS
jgi:hypothetical protein